MVTKAINIEKMSGELVPFNESKLVRSLERSGASDKAIETVLNEVRTILNEGISTKEIYQKAFGILKKLSRPTAAKYKLKKAIIELGPTGYPFEEFISRILSYQGFKVEVGVIVMGHCVKHEVDVVAEKEMKHFMVECKFHSDQKRRCDVKIPLYIQSRFKDVEKQWRKQLGHDKKFHQGWICTNTRFTSDAIQYGNCIGLNLIGWDYPKQGSLKERINISGAHPITCLTTLTKQEKLRMIKEGHVLCMDICKQPNLLNDFGIKKNKHQKILYEAHAVCGM